LYDHAIFAGGMHDGRLIVVSVTHDDTA